ncbi:MAG: beta-Ala-His dipeptidase [Spirochaetales bacterium]|nr:beta-Ala-His dipeptidase [Spirochaetales bacterium]
MSKQALGALEPRNVWTLFEEITKVPRCSGKEERIRAWVKSWAANRGVSCAEDAVGNLLLRLPASAGWEGVPVLVLQAHLDMVCARAPDSAADFDTAPTAAAPIRPWVDGDWVRAQGTTLGADNGIGMAYALAALTDPALQHGPLEALLTVDEEGGMKGAFGLKPGFFTGAHLLNLDSEELGLVTIGTAGGEYTDYSLSAPRLSAGGWVPLEVAVEGLAGGHSGIEIHLPRLNAIKVLLSGLEELEGRESFRIASLEGGTASNVIPPSARCLALVPPASLQAALAVLASWRERTLAEEREREPGITIAVRAAASAGAAAGYSAEDSARICRLLAEIPHGPLAYSREIEGLVETSNNLALVKSGDGRLEIFVNARSSIDSALQELSRSLREIGERHGTTVRQHTRYPGWAADPRSPFNLLVKQEYEAELGAPIQLKAFHAGLECGVFKGIAPDLEMVSLGPTLRGVHSPQEAVEVPSVGIVWKVIRRVIAAMGRLAGSRA